MGNLINFGTLEMQKIFSAISRRSSKWRMYDARTRENNTKKPMYNMIPLPFGGPSTFREYQRKVDIVEAKKTLKSLIRDSRQLLSQKHKRPLSGSEAPMPEK